MAGKDEIDYEEPPRERLPEKEKALPSTREERAASKRRRKRLPQAHRLDEVFSRTLLRAEALLSTFAQRDGGQHRPHGGGTADIAAAADRTAERGETIVVSMTESTQALQFER